MILKSVLTTAILLLLYTLIIVSCHDSIKHTGQNTFQRNTAKAEEYVYEANSHYDTVLVGSSMSERLIMDSLPGPCYNLAMAGLSSLDGLQLIKQSARWPRLIYVEQNTLDRGQTSDLLRMFNNPRRQFINQYFPFLRQKYQPVGVVKSVLRNWKYGQTQFVDFGGSTLLDTTFQTKAVQEKLQEMDHGPADSVLRAHVQVAWQYVEAFRRKGTKIVFYEMPVDRRLQNHRLTSCVRQCLRARFPASQFPTVCVPPDAYQTSDGVHLTRSENIRYTAYLRKQLNQLAEGYLVSQTDPNVNPPFVRPGAGR